MGGLIALSFKEMNCLYIFISLAVLFFFWLLDGYYLSRERLFIKLYDHVREKKDANTDYSMHIEDFYGRADWLKGSFSKTVGLFYGGLLIVHIFVIILI